jgi:hypothetical protein
MSDKSNQTQNNPQWFPTPEQMTQAVKSGGVLTYTPTPEQHLEDAKKGKVTNFAKPKRP